MKTQCDIGFIGLAVMGENLVRNMAGKGVRVAVYNRTASVVQAFVDEGLCGQELLANPEVRAAYLEGGRH